MCAMLVHSNKGFGSRWLVATSAPYSQPLPSQSPRVNFTEAFSRGFGHASEHRPVGCRHLQVGAGVASSSQLPVKTTRHLRVKTPTAKWRKYLHCNDNDFARTDRHG